MTTTIRPSILWSPFIYMRRSGGIKGAFMLSAILFRALPFRALPFRGLHAANGGTNGYNSSSGSQAIDN
jgi:hypothetical protein